MIYDVEFSLDAAAELFRIAEVVGSAVLVLQAAGRVHCSARLGGRVHLKGGYAVPVHPSFTPLRVAYATPLALDLQDLNSLLDEAAAPNVPQPNPDTDRRRDPTRTTLVVTAGHRFRPHCGKIDWPQPTCGEGYLTNNRHS